MDSLRAKQGQKALSDVKEQQAKNQADTNRAMKNMQKIKLQKQATADDILKR